MKTLLTKTPRKLLIKTFKSRPLRSKSETSLVATQLTLQMIVSRSPKMTAVFLSLCLHLVPVFAATTCPEAVIHLRRLRDEFKQPEAIRLSNIFTRYIRSTYLYKAKPIARDQWIIGREVIPEAIVCDTKRKAMELLVKKLEQGIHSNELTNATNLSFIEAAGDMMLNVYPISKKTFASIEHRRLFFVAYQTMVREFYIEFTARNSSFNDLRILNRLLAVCEFVGETLIERFYGLENSTQLMVAESEQLAEDLVLEFPSISYMSSKAIDISGTVISALVTGMNVLFLPAYITFYHRNRKVYEMLYIILMNILDIGIAAFYFVVNSIILKFTPVDSSWKCLTMFVTGDTRIGFDIRIIISIILQACLSTEKFLQIWQAIHFKREKQYTRVIRCACLFSFVFVTVITLQTISLQEYEQSKTNFAVKRFREIIAKLFEISIAPNCEVYDQNKILFQNGVSWFLRASAILSAIISMIFNVLTSIVISNNMNKSTTDERQKASYVFFKQIVWYTILLSLIIIVAFVAVVLSEFYNRTTASLLVICLPNAVSFFRNGVYLGSSKKLRSHIQNMVCKKSV